MGARKAHSIRASYYYHFTHTNWLHSWDLDVVLMFWARRRHPFSCRLFRIPREKVVKKHT